MEGMEVEADKSELIIGKAIRVLPGRRGEVLDDREGLQSCERTVPPLVCMLSGQVVATYTAYSAAWTQAN